MYLDKIYSRPRIRFRNKKNQSSKQKIKKLILKIIIIIFILLVIFFKAAYPIFIASCETEATSTAINILNDEVNEAMIIYTYDDLVNVVKDDNGSVSYIEAKIVPINQLITEITGNIQAEIDNTDSVIVDINLGTISGISILSNISPKLKIKLESGGAIESEISSEFTSVGINQTLHRIYLNLECKIEILTPFETIAKSISAEVLLTETIIVGDVPSSYYNYDNLGFEDVLNTVN